MRPRICDTFQIKPLANSLLCLIKDSTCLHIPEYIYNVEFQMIKLYQSLLASLLLTLLFCGAPVFGEHIHTPYANTPKDKLILQLLQLSLSKTEKHYTFSSEPNGLSTGRKSEKISHNQMQVYWAGMSPELEKADRPIRIPIFKGLLGHRIFVVKKGTSHKFSKIETIDDLKTLKAGQGQFWGDTKILEAAGITVVKASQGENLWAMLDEGRFDYLALALHEPWTEIEKRKTLNVEVEPSLLVIYPFAMYFYVHSQNGELHKAISEGMHAAIEDGSYDALLFSDPLMRNAITKAKAPNRKIIRINNPTLHEDTPTHNQAYWFDPLNTYTQAAAPREQR